MNEFDKFMDELLLKENITINSSKEDLKKFDKKYNAMFSHYFAKNCSLNDLKDAIKIIDKIVEEM